MDDRETLAWTIWATDPGHNPDMWEAYKTSALPGHRYSVTMAYDTADGVLASDWLAGVKAEAWSEGFSAGWGSPTGEMTSNPYRTSANAHPETEPK
jgi:hypothetical protein